MYMSDHGRQDCSIFDNSFNQGPCDIDICIDSLTESCLCSSASYFLSAACSSCLGMATLSWTDFANQTHCGVNATPANPSPYPNEDFLPSWVISMASATPSPTTFDAQAASSLGSSISAAGPFPTPASSVAPPGTLSTLLSDSKSTVTHTASASSLASAAPPGSSSSFTKSTITDTSSSTTSDTQTSTNTPPSKHTIRTGVIVGIAVGIVFIFSAVALLLRRHCRRRRRSIGFSVDSTDRPFPLEEFPDENSSMHIARPYSVLYPEMTAIVGDSNNEPGDGVEALTKARREYLRHELQAAQEKIAYIQNQQRPPSGRATRLRSLVRMGTRPRSDTEAVSRLREQNAMQEARIRELEAQMNSAWALGLSDEPPPGYEEGMRTEL
ncbi:hypothetical protein FB45DRAFT_1009155 [Roridomyces roridus]|uniref:Uncharacterized protein n=1 Tax=Roridomyces roridus TaxID=1738132 RepID=A0AAD7B7Z8_9AGAR|nr:hypothetical protein FB45DRAFT_1009155 [Roridomyces roridus]